MSVDLNSYGGRKFLFSVYAFTVNSLLVTLGIITGPIYQVISLGIITGYLAANVSQKVFTGDKQ